MSKARVEAARELRTRVLEAPLTHGLVTPVESEEDGVPKLRLDLVRVEERLILEPDVDDMCDGATAGRLSFGRQWRWQQCVCSHSVVISVPTPHAH